MGSKGKSDAEKDAEAAEAQAKKLKRIKDIQLRRRALAIQKRGRFAGGSSLFDFMGGNNQTLG